MPLDSGPLNITDPSRSDGRPVLAIIDLVRHTIHIASPDDRGERMAAACANWAKAVADAAKRSDPDRAVDAVWNLVGALAGAYIAVAGTPISVDSPGSGSASA